MRTIAAIIAVFAGLLLLAPGIVGVNSYWIPPIVWAATIGGTLLVALGASALIQPKRQTRLAVALLLVVGAAIVWAAHAQSTLWHVCEAVNSQNHDAIRQARHIIDMIELDDMRAVDPAFRPIFDAGCAPP